MGFSNDDGAMRENAQRFAKSGAQLGATAGSRVGPAATGLASGLGGAIGYLTGAAVDGLQQRIEQKPAAADGGQSRADVDTATSGTDIPVVEDS